MRRPIALLLVAGSLLCPTLAAAAEPDPATMAEPAPTPTAKHAHSTAPICDAAESDDYITKTSGQFFRGIVNLSCCWVELFNQPVVAYREGRNVPVGFVKGIGHTLLRGGKGLGETLLCWDPRDPKSGNFPKPLSNDCAFGVLGLEDR